MPQRRSWLRRRKIAPGEHSWIQSRKMELGERKPELVVSKLALVGRTIALVGRTIALEERKIAPGEHSWLLRHKLSLEVRSWLLGRKSGLEGIRLRCRKMAPEQSNRHRMMEGQIRSWELGRIQQLGPGRRALVGGHPGR